MIKLFPLLLVGVLLISSSGLAGENCEIADPNSILAAKDVQNVQDILSISLDSKESDGALTAKQLSCVQAFKNNVKAGMLLPFQLPNNPKLMRAVNTINRFLPSAILDRNGDQYIRSSVRKDRTTGIELDHVYRGDTPSRDISVKMTYSLNAILDPLSGEKKLLESIEATFYKNEKTMMVVAQSGYVADNCVPKFQYHSETLYYPEGARTLIKGTLLAADGNSEENEVRVDTSALEFGDRLDRMTQDPRLMAKLPQHMENKSLGGTDAPDGYTKIDRFEVQGAQSRYPHLFRIENYQNSQLSDSTLIGMSADFSTGLMKTVSANAPNEASYKELISQSAWDKVNLEFVNSDLLKSENFSLHDIQSDDLDIVLDTEAPLDFNNWDAYGKLTLESNLNGKRHHIFHSSKAAAPQPQNIDVQHYTRETKLYDFRSKSVAEVVELIRRKNLKTRKDTVLAILSELGQRVQYNYASLQLDTVRAMKASQTLEEKSGVCQNFSAVFVAIARGLGIPAREIEGPNLGAPVNADGSVVTALLHAWVEVSMDNKTWTPLEPQHSDRIGIDDRSYIPLGEASEYEQTATETPGLSTGERLENLKLSIKNYKK